MKFSIICRNDEKSNKISDKIKKALIHTLDNDNPDIVIAVGGDGTLLKAFHSYPNAILFGVHTGSLGFYANYGVNDVDLLIEAINNHSYSIECMDLLNCKMVDYNDNVIINNALNEITIVNPTKTLILDVYIDNAYFEKFRGTGMCISTPSGSTAYNKSLHGSVIDSTIKCMQLTEIAGINSNAYRTLASPLVLSSDRSIKLFSDIPQDVYVTVDTVSYSAKDFKEISISYSNNVLKMGYSTSEGFFNRINRTFLKNN